LPSLEVHEGVTVRRFPTLHGDDVYFCSPQLFRWLRQHGSQYRLVHAHGYHNLVLVTSWAAIHGQRLPLVATPHYHGGGHTRLRRLLHVPYRPVAMRVLRAARAVIANSEAERGWLERDVPGLAVRVIQPGVDLPDAPGSDAAVVDLDRDPGESTVLAVGRLADYKQVDRVVSALPLLPAAVRLTVVGDGPAAGRIRAVAAELGVADRVRMRGAVPAAELRAWYAVADAFVTMSTDEAFGLTVLEAAAAGAPVVASDIPAHRESQGLVAPGRICLVDPRANGADLARAVLRAVAVGRSTDLTGWRLPTWQGLVDGVAGVYGEVLGEPLGADAARRSRGVPSGAFQPR
jgi:glycosyltransferase involved in cell wall biosynthesis